MNELKQLGKEKIQTPTITSTTTKADLSRNPLTMNSPPKKSNINIDDIHNMNTSKPILLDLPQLDVRDSLGKREKEKSQNRVENPTMEFTSKMKDSHLQVHWHRFFKEVPSKGNQIEEKRNNK